MKKLAVVILAGCLATCGGGDSGGETSNTESSSGSASPRSDARSATKKPSFDPDNLPLDAKLDAAYDGPPYRSDEKAIAAFTEAYEEVDLNEMQKVWWRLNAGQRLTAYQKAQKLSGDASMADYKRMRSAQDLLNAENLTELVMAAQHEADANDPTLGNLRGKVLEEGTNAPIAGVSLHGLVTSAADGSFEITGQRPGTLPLSINSQTHKFRVHEVEIVANETVETTIYLKPQRAAVPASELATVRGVVVDKDTGEPIEGMAIMISFGGNAMAILQGDASDWGAVTASDGSFEISGIPPGPALLVGQKPPYFIQAHKMTIQAREIRQERIEIQPLRGRIEIPAMVAGVVRDAVTGEPVAGVRVKASRGRGATSDEEGRYFIRKTEIGEQTLVARHPDYHEFGEPLVTEKPGKIDRDIELQPITTGSILGVAVDRTTGEPLAGAVVTIAGQTFETDSEGRFRIDELEAGEIAVQANSDGYRAARSDVLLEARSETEARLELDPITEGAVAGIVRDKSTGQALAGVLIQIGAFGAETGADGRFELSDIPAGDASVTARKAVYEPSVETVEVLAARSIEVELALEPITYGTLIVVVQDSTTGRPIADSSVSVTGAASSRTDAEGRARFERVAAGKGLVSAERHAFETGQETFELAPATELEQIVRLDPVTVGTVEGQVLAAGSRRPIPGATISLGERRATAGTDGRFRFGDVNAGSANLVARKPVFEPGSKAVKVIAAESVTVDFELEPITWGSITGVVVDAGSGEPIAGAQVAVTGATAESDSRGRFELERVPAGRVQLSASRRVYESARTTFELEPAATVERRLALQPITTGRLTGRVVDAETGKAIAGAEVSFSDKKTTSGRDGRFEAEGVTAGLITVSGRKHAYDSGGVTVTLKPAGSAEAVVELEPIKIGTVVGVVKDEKTGEPIPGARVACGQRSVEADSRGRFQCDEVEVGAVGVSARHADYGDGAVSGNLGGGDTLELELRLDLRREDVTQLEAGLASKGSIDLYGIHFDSGKDQFKPSSLGTLNAVLEVIKRAPGKTFRIAGHTDSDGTDASNQDLSERRARTVIDWLVERGIDASRLHRVGYGESRPAAPNDTASGKALNRRVELSYAG